MLSVEDKISLKQYITTGNHSARSIRRARMLLLLAEGLKNQKQVAADCHCSAGSVINLLNRYEECKGVLEEKPVAASPPLLLLNRKPT